MGSGLGSTMGVAVGAGVAVGNGVGNIKGVAVGNGVGHSGEAQATPTITNTDAPRSVVSFGIRRGMGERGLSNANPFYTPDATPPKPANMGWGVQIRSDRGRPVPATGYLARYEAISKTVRCCRSPSDTVSPPLVATVCSPRCHGRMRKGWVVLIRDVAVELCSSRQVTD